MHNTILSGYKVTNGICDECMKPFAKITTIHRCECDTFKLRLEIKELKLKIKELEKYDERRENRTWDKSRRDVSCTVS